jgi:hypothetical protein
MSGPGATAVIFRDTVVAAPSAIRDLGSPHETVRVLDEALRLIETLALGNALRTGDSAVMYQGLSAAAHAGGMVVTTTMTTGDTLNLYQGLPINLSTSTSTQSVTTGAINTIYVSGGAVWTRNWQIGVGQSLSSPASAPTVPSTTYGDLFTAITQLEGLDREDTRFVDQDSARAARAFVSLLSLYSVAAPQLFSHGGDAVVFKWARPDQTKYVTLVDGTASLRAYISGQPTGPAKPFRISAESELVALMLGLGGKRWQAVNAA